MALQNKYPSLKDRVVFVTGGATGIGASIVSACWEQKAKVVFVDIADAPAKELCDQLHDEDGHHRPIFRHCDLRDVEQLQSIIREAEEVAGPISTLVNNAADDRRHDFTKLTLDDWNDRIAVNLRHAFFAIQAAHPQMKKCGGGSVINFGSMSWYECQGNMTGYTTSKAGIEGMTRGLARDLGQDCIRINTIVPGWVMTEKQIKERVTPESKAQIEQSQCLKDPLQPDDISAMVLFLASDDSRMCTAQSFIVDGGWI